MKIIKFLKNQTQKIQTRISFGATSALITNLGLIVGFDKLPHPQPVIISSILAVALADNISDSMGIHIYQESECINHKEAWLSTFTNFMTRLCVSLTFVLIIWLLPIKSAVICSVIWGLFLLSVLSYMIAKVRKVNPYTAMLEHVGIAILVIFASNLLSHWISSKF